MKKEIIKKSVFMEVFGANPEARVLDYLLSISPLDCSITDVAESAGVSRTTLHYRIIPDLVRSGVLVSRKVGRLKLYRLNEANPLAAKLLEVDRELILGELKNRLRRTKPVMA